MRYGYAAGVLTLAMLCGACDTRPANPAGGPPPQSATPATQATAPPAQKPQAVDPSLDVPAAACDESKDEHELVGRWQAVSAEIGGRKVPADGYYEFQGTTLTVSEAGEKYTRTFEVDPKSNPKRLDSRQVTPRGTIVFRAIYKVEGDTLTVVDSKPFTARPEGFVERTTAEDDLGLATFRRAPK